MKLFSTLALLALFCLSAQAQANFWRDISESEIQLQPTAEKAFNASHYRVVTIDMAGLRQMLAAAPMENTPAAVNQPMFAAIPLPDGTTEVFRIEESPVMMPELAARYPQIKTYRAIGLDHSSSYGRFEYTPDGFGGVFYTSKGEVWIDRYATRQDRYYASYFSRDVVINPDEVPVLGCGYQPDAHEGEDPVIESLHETMLESRSNAPIEKRVYLLALACTGEFAQQFGGTLESVNSAYATALNRFNQIYEKELAIKLMLIASNDLLIWLDPATDPYVSANDAASLLGQNTNAITQVGGVPLGAFDMGHVFTSSCVGGPVGIAALGQVCKSGKARGVTCFISSNINFIVKEIMAHELGHQFSAQHSWANCPGADAQLASGSAYEPGSGSTIMSYAGACGMNQNIQFQADDYFHIRSLEEIIEFSRFDDGNSCPTFEPTGNTEPLLTLNYADNFHIPIGTPFELIASAEDAEGDNLTYCWEQYNLGPVTLLGEPQGDAPIFRSYPPTSAGNRVFPRLQTLVNNSSSVVEVLPTYTRNLTFRCTVRDNFPGAGAVVWKEVRFKATDTAGPFLVTAPNEPGIVWEAGKTATVTWDVANTTNSLVNCQAVNIRLSLDGGFTYPITLLSGTPNDGSETVLIPHNVTNQARIRVEAAGNIFFDISNANFQIVAPSAAGFGIAASSEQLQRVCLPNTAMVTMTTTAFLDFNNPISLEVVDGLPAGATATFSANTINPGESVDLLVDLTNYNTAEFATLTIRGAAVGADTAYASVYLRLVSTDFSEAALLAPADGTSGLTLSALMTWAPSPNATSYDFELATSPAFGSTVIESVQGLTATSYQTINFFEENTLYFWRVRPVNECGPGDYLPPFTFHTQSVNCTPYQATGLPLNIPGSGPLPTIQSNINVTAQGVISDVNVPLVKANYQPVKSLRLSLISPAGTTVRLYDQQCFNTQNLFIGFDDDAPSAVLCPPDDGIVFQPFQPMSAFIGENIQGQWTLQVRVMQAGFGTPGVLEQWGLEFCASLTPSNPFIVHNDTLFVPPAAANYITTDELETLDADNTPQQIEYTIVTPPAHGVLYLQGQALGAGSVFRQSTINAFNLQYLHNGDGSENDNFTFVVRDGAGGWIPTQRFNIKVDPGAVVGTAEPAEEKSFALYPNPATREVNVALRRQMSGPVEVRIINAGGQEALRRSITSGDSILTLDTAALAAGIYFVQVQTAEGVQTQKLILQR